MKVSYSQQLATEPYGIREEAPSQPLHPGFDGSDGCLKAAHERVFILDGEFLG